jgi:tellurite resistance protein
MIERCREGSGPVPRLTPNLFGIPFGLCGLAGCWSAAHLQGAEPAWPGYLIWILAAIVWLVVLAFYGRDLVTSGRWRTELSDPTFGPFVALATIVLMSLGTELGNHAHTAGEVFFGIGLVGTLLIGGWLTGQWILDDGRLAQWHPGYFLPTAAGGLLASIGASSLGWFRIGEVMFGFGIVCWLVLGSILLLRLFTEPTLPTALLPTMAIEIAPPVVASLAWFGLNGAQEDAVVLGLGGYALLMALVQLRLIPIYRTVPFGISWWAFSFSYAVVFLLAIRWLTVTNPDGGRAWTGVLLAVVTLAMVALAVRTVMGLANGTFLPKAAPPGSTPAEPAA